MTFITNFSALINKKQIANNMMQSLKRPRSITLLSIAGILAISIQSVLQLNLVQFGLFGFNNTQQNGSHSNNVSDSSRLDNSEEEIDNEEADTFYRRYLISNSILENNHEDIVEDFDTAAEYAQQESTSTLHLPNPSPDELASTTSQLVVQPYSISDALYESTLWEYTFCILGKLYLLLWSWGRLVEFFFIKCLSDMSGILKCRLVYQYELSYHQIYLI